LAAICYTCDTCLVATGGGPLSVAKAFEAASKRSSFGSVVTTRLGAIHQFLESSLGFMDFEQRPIVKL